MEQVAIAIVTAFATKLEYLLILMVLAGVWKLAKEGLSTFSSQTAALVDAVKTLSKEVGDIRNDIKDVATEVRVQHTKLEALETIDGLKEKRESSRDRELRKRFLDE
jgi:uncharacterized protein (UPF0335 family)